VGERMEMVPMMTQAQDTTALVSGMAAAGNAPSGLPRLSATSLLFSAVLMEIMPPAQAGAESAEMWLKQAPTEKGALPGKDSAAVNPACGLADNNGAAVVEQSPDPNGIQLAQLLVITGKNLLDQSPPQPAAPEGSQAEELKRGVRPNSPSGEGEETDEMNFQPSAPVYSSIQCPGPEGVVLPTGMETAAQEIMAESGNLKENSNPLHQSRTPGSAWNDNLTPQQPQQVADKQAAGISAITQGQAGKPSQSAAATVSPEPSSGQMQSGQSVFGGVQPQVMQSSFLPQTDKNWTDASQQVRSTDEQTMKGQSNQNEANKVDYVSLSGRVPAFQAGMEAAPQKDACAVTGTPANLLVEVVFKDPSVNDKPSEGNENRKPRDKEKKNETSPGLAITPARTFDMPGSSRFALQPKVEEPKNLLHGSILDQVKASVVSHDSKGNGVMTVRLSPKELGDLQVNVRIENQQVKVEIITDNRTVRDALMGNLENLKETFLKQNLNMERFDVSTGAGNGFGQGFRGERGDQRHISSLPFSHEAVPLEIVRENGEDDWGITENSLVNLRL
jgi:flagellar hook-length control protein FliK